MTKYEKALEDLKSTFGFDTEITVEVSASQEIIEKIQNELYDEYNKYSLPSGKSFLPTDVVIFRFPFRGTLKLEVNGK